MEKKTAILSTTLAVYLFGPPGRLLEILIVCIAIDYLTGVLRAAYERRLSSKVGAKGIIKKIGYLSAVALAHQIDLWLGSGNMSRTLSISLFISNEVWSNFENFAAMGIVFPKPVVDKIRSIMANASKEVSTTHENHS